MDFILNKVMDFLSRNSNVDDDKAEVVRYGLEIVLLKSLFTLCVLIIGFLFHSFLECIVFLVLFSFLRSNAGGYHADTRIKCFLESMLSYITVLIILNIASSRFSAILILSFITVVSIGIIWFFAPMDNPNKRLNEDDCKYFAVKTKVILCVEILIVLSAFLLDRNTIACSSMLSIILTAVLLLWGLLKDNK